MCYHLEACFTLTSTSVHMYVLVCVFVYTYITVEKVTQNRFVSLLRFLPYLRSTAENSREIFYILD